MAGKDIKYTTEEKAKDVSHAAKVRGKQGRGKAYMSDGRKECGGHVQDEGEWTHSPNLLCRGCAPPPQSLGRQHPTSPAVRPSMLSPTNLLPLCSL